MQKSCPKNLIIFFLFIFFSLGNVFGQISGYRLRQADSLFVAKRYVQSLEHYKVIFKQREYTPAMLLKMAYIEEGLNHSGKALYYLSLYQQVTQNKAVLVKMEELAEKNNLEGYQQNDIDWLLTYYHDHHFLIAIVLAVFIFLTYCLSVFLKRRKESPWFGLSGMIVMVLMLLMHINMGNKVATAIVAQDKTLLMDGPSAGAEVVAMVAAGNKVEIIGQQDVWAKVAWAGKIVFVKQNNLLMSEMN